MAQGVELLPMAVMCFPCLAAILDGLPLIGAGAVCRHLVAGAVTDARPLIQTMQGGKCC